MSSTLVQIAEQFADEQSRFDGSSPTARRAKLGQTEWGRQVLSEAIAMAQLITHWREGSRKAGAAVLEALSTSDLAKYASGEIVEREMLANYDAAALQWPKFLKSTTVGSFKPKYMSTQTLNGQLLKDVPELSPYPKASGPDINEYPISVKKTGILWGFSFEARINDDLDQLMMVPDAFPQMATDTEDDRALRLMINLDTGALNTAFFKAANNNIGTLKLTTENLLTVWTNLTSKRDPVRGGLIPAGNLMLVVGPALQPTAERILGTQRIERTLVDGSKVYEDNPVAGKFRLVVNEKQLGTAWMVLPDPGTTRRPALWFAKMRGWETPDFRYAANQGRALGGGQLGVDDGSFDEDAIWYRARHIMGVAHGDPTLTYGSDNTGA